MTTMFTRKYIKAALVLCFVLTLFACGKKAADNWQEQYDLGQKYLLELNYEQALIAFTNAIEIDPAKGEAYIGRGDTYAAIALASLDETDIDQAYLNAQNDYETALSSMELTYDLFEKLATVYELQGNDDALLALIEQAKDVLGEDDTRLRNWLDAHSVPDDEGDDSTGQPMTLNELIPELDPEAYMALFRVMPVSNAAAGTNTVFIDYYRTPAEYAEAYGPLIQPLSAFLENATNQEDIVQAGHWLEDVYYLTGDMDNVLKTRTLVYEKTGSDEFDPNGYVDTFDERLEYFYKFNEYGATEKIFREDNGYESNYVYDAQGRILTVGSLSAGGRYTEYSYTDDGRIAVIHSYESVGVNNEVIDTGKYEYAYDGDTVTITYVPSLPSESGQVSRYQIDKFGNSTFIS